VRKVVWLAFLTFGALAVCSAEAAEPIGPFCMQTDVAGSLLQFYFIPTGASDFLLTGRFITLFGSVPAMGTGFATATQFHMGVTLFVGGATTFLAGNISLTTLTGNLSCEDVDGGCTTFHISGVSSCP